MKKKPKSVRIAEWNKTMKHLQSKIDYYKRLIATTDGVIDSDSFNDLLSNRIYWENQRSAHISTKPI